MGESIDDSGAFLRMLVCLDGMGQFGVKDGGISVVICIMGFLWWPALWYIVLCCQL